MMKLIGADKGLYSWSIHSGGYCVWIHSSCNSYGIRGPLVLCCLE